MSISHWLKRLKYKRMFGSISHGDGLRLAQKDISKALIEVSEGKQEGKVGGFNWKWKG